MVLIIIIIVMAIDFINCFITSIDNFIDFVKIITNLHYLLVYSQNIMKI